MANYQLLKADIDEKVYQNGRQEITGENLNYVLNQMVTTLGAEYQFAGVATKDTNPGTPDAKVFYIANGKGTYTNFGSLEVTEDDVVVLYWDTAWHKVSTGIASQEKLTELESKCEILDTIDDEPTAGSDNLVKGGGIIKLNRQILRNIGVLAENEQYTYPNTDVLFTSDQVPAGTRVYFKLNGNNARIGLYAIAESTTPIDYFGTVSGSEFEGSYLIPSNLEYAVAKVNYTSSTNSSLQIKYLRLYDINEKIDSNTENVQTRDISIFSTKLPNISTHDKTLTIYQGSVIKVKKDYHSLDQDTVVDLTAASSEDKIVVYNINTHILAAKNYSAVLSDSEAVIMSMRSPVNNGVLLVRSVSCYGTNVSIDGTDIKKVTIQNKRDIAGLLFDNHISIEDYPSNRTTNGITFDIKDGAIIANGTATANVTLAFTNTYKTLSELGLKANTKYHLFGCPKGGGSGVYRFLIDNDGTAGTRQYIDYGDGVDVVFTNTNDKYRFAITIYNGVVANNLTFYPSLVEYTGALEAVENRTLTSNVKVFADSLPNIASSNAILSIPQMILKVVDKYYSISSAVTLDLKGVNTQDKVVAYNTKTGSVSVKGYGDIVADTEIMLWCIRIVSNGTDYEVRSVSGVSDVMVDGSTPDKKAIYDHSTIKNALVDNLIDLTSIYLGKYWTSNGITFKRDGNKIVANGTATAAAVYQFSSNYLSLSELGIEVGKEYHLYGCPKGGSASKYEFQMSNDGTAGAVDYKDYGEGCLVNPFVGKYKYRIIIRSGQAVNNLVFEPALVEYKGVIKEHEARITALDNDTIANLNKDSVNGIKAATAKYMSAPNDGSNYYPAFLIITDLHGDWKRMDRALDFAENNENIKLVLLLGDIVEQSSQFNNAGNDYRARVLSMTKPVLTIVGNHEVSQDPNATHGLSDSEIFNMFYDSELVEHNGDVHPTIDGVTKNYFYRDYTIEHSGNSATIRFICLYQYEWNSPLDANNKPICNEETAGFGKDVGLYTQDQIDWLVETLKAAKTNDYYVVIVSHSIVGSAIGLNSIWNQPDIRNEEINSNWPWIRANNKSFINEIITSFVNGGACNVSTNQETPDGQLNPISIDTTFVAGGKFIGNVCGHKHQGAVCKITSSDNKLSLRALISNTSSSFQVQQTNWIPRSSDGKMQDCFNVVVYDYNRDKFKVVKVGANWTADNDVLNGIMI